MGWEAIRGFEGGLVQLDHDLEGPLQLLCGKLIVVEQEGKQEDQSESKLYQTSGRGEVHGGGLDHHEWYLWRWQELGGLRCIWNS